MPSLSLRILYLRWIAANAFGEVFGLGLTLLVGGLLITHLDQAGTVGAILAAFAIAVASGAIEATIVGLSQWWAMHPWFQSVRRRDWWFGTLAGALAAYVLGYLPSTLIGLSQQAESARAETAVEPPQWVVLLLAAGMGLVAGAILSIGQMPPLRKASRSARLWIPANMLAWMAGMPLVFAGIDLAQGAGSILVIGLVMAFTLLLTGVVVGAVHGLFLLRIATETVTTKLDEVIPA